MPSIPKGEAMGRARGIRTRIVDEKAIEGLAESLRREGRAPGTVECYLRAARAFSRWLGGRPVAEG